MLVQHASTRYGLLCLQCHQHKKNASSYSSSISSANAASRSFDLAGVSAASSAGLPLLFLTFEASSFLASALGAEALTSDLTSLTRSSSASAPLAEPRETPSD